MLSRNIPLLYLIKLSKWFMLYIPISLLYYRENNFGIGEYLTLHAVYSGVVAILEVPSGYVADVWGRKHALLLGSVFGVLGFGVYSISSGLALFLVAEILLGIGQSLISGADSAMLYDSLLQNKNENKYLKHEGNISALGNIAEVSAGVFVSIIVLSSYREYFYYQTFISFAGVIAALFLIEPKLHKNKLEVSFREIFNVAKTTFTENPRLKNLLIFSSVIAYTSLSMAWLSQPLLEAMKVKGENYGFILAGLNLLVACGSFLSMRISSVFSRSANILFIGVPLSIAYFIIAIQIGWWSFIPLGIFYFVRGAAHPILKKYINDITTSERRATVLSLRSLVSRVMFFGIGPLLGIASEKISVNFALLLCGTTVIIPTIVFSFYLLRSKDSEVSKD